MAVVHVPLIETAFCLVQEQQQTRESTTSGYLRFPLRSKAHSETEGSVGMIPCPVVLFLLLVRFRGRHHRCTFGPTLGNSQHQSVHVVVVFSEAGRFRCKHDVRGDPPAADRLLLRTLSTDLFLLGVLPRLGGLL